MFTNRRPYYGLKMSTTDFFREPVRYLKESNTQESMMEKPYLEDEYPKMHLKLPGFKYKPKKPPGFLKPIANGDPFPGLAMIDFGDAKCGWRITNLDHCTEESVIITMTARYLWRAEFDFVAEIKSDTIGVFMRQLAGTAARSWDEQDYMITFPKDANGSVTVCGFASTHTLISQTFETVVAGMPVGIHLIGGAMLPIERGQSKPATLLKSVYGDKGDSCGCIELSSNCVPSCECKSIGFTTYQMSTNESQELTVNDPVEGCTYDWAIIEGDGQLSLFSGTSTTYTAPSDNANCVKNPRISLSVDGSVCNIIGLAVNDPSQTGYAYRDFSGDASCAAGYCKKIVFWYRCDGGTTYSHNTSCVPDTWISCSDVGDCGECETGNVDIRTDEQIAGGCCAAGLL